MFGFIHKFPYSNFHEINLDWIISEVKKLQEEFAVLKKDTDNAIDYMTDNIYETTTEIINQAIIDGAINVGINYDAVNEELDIIVTQ